MARSITSQRFLSVSVSLTKQICLSVLGLLLMMAATLEAQNPPDSSQPGNTNILLPEGGVDSSYVKTAQPDIEPYCYPLPPEGPACQDFCAANDPVVGDLEATGEAIKWYDAPEGGTVLPADAPLVTGHYYASQTVDGYESDRLDVSVTIVDPGAPAGPAEQSFCAAGGSCVADLEAEGDNILWYATPTGGSPLAADLALVQDTYYASQTVSGCESTLRLEAYVTIHDPAPPSAPGQQTFCASDNPVVGDLDADGDNILWYAMETGGSPLAADLALVQDTYYASQTVSGCESTTRLEVSVHISDPAPPDGPGYQAFCAADHAVVGDLEASGQNIRWYAVQEGGPQLGSDESLTTGVYFASQTVDGCESIERLQVSVEVGATPVTSQITGKEDPGCNETGLTYSVDLTAGSAYEWQVPEGATIVSGASGPENHLITVDFGRKGGILSVTETSALGCAGSPVELVVTLPDCGPLAGFIANETEACIDEEILFTDLSEDTNENTVYSWDFGMGAVPAGASTAGPHAVAYSTPGLKSVQLTVTGAVPNTLIRTDYIMVFPDPVVDLGRDTALCNGNSLLLDAGDHQEYDWSTGAVTRTIIVYEGAGTVSVTVTDENGCEAGDAIVILNCNPADLLSIPNVFTPNNDQIHDAWVIGNIHMFPEVTIIVYDRWGRLVYETDGGYGNDWYGTDPNGKDLPVGTYYYVIDLKVQGAVVIKGSVSILR